MANPAFFDDRQEADAAAAETRFEVDIDGFEGPLELLLDLARRNKIDLHAISILALADQYLAFIEAARRVRLDIAGDYLVMAAYLAYLKSRQLVPEARDENEPSSADLAADLSARLKRLEALRHAAAALENRNRLGRDVFACGMPTVLRGGHLQGGHLQGGHLQQWTASLHELLTTYARLRSAETRLSVVLARRTVWSLQTARELLERLLEKQPSGNGAAWSELDELIRPFFGAPDSRRTIRASTFSAALELVREGRLSVRQSGPFSPIHLRGAAANACPGETLRDG